MKLSIIIPVYKVEEYLKKCLDSLLDQDFAPDEYEVIIINDGSPDNSKAIALEYAAKHPNFIFIDQENQGVSVARNAGLEEASGDYVAFIDPDDSIYEHSLKPIVAHAYRDDIDVLYLGLDAYDENGKLILRTDKIGEEGTVSDGFSHARRTYPSTLYKRANIGKLRFKKGILRGQDTVFNCMVHAMAKRVSYCAIPYYKYLQRETSSRQFVGSERNFISCLLAIETINDFRNECFPDQTAQQKQYFDDAILIFVQRTLEWNIFPQKSKDNFNRLKAKLEALGLGYLIGAASEKFPMFDKPFAIFMAYHKLNSYYHGLMHKFAKK